VRRSERPQPGEPGEPSQPSERRPSAGSPPAAGAVRPPPVAEVAEASERLMLRSGRGRWVLAATVGASSMAFLDGTVVNVALPTMARDLDTDLAGMQWVLNGYLLATASLILLGGSLGDIFGRRKVFLAGVACFALSSLACGLAPEIGSLVGARVVQGVGGALLTPASLAILEASFRRQDRARAIGAWSGLSGVASAAGPFLGGWLVDAASWRWVFLLNLPLAAAVVLVASRHVPETRNPHTSRQIDVTGALVIAGALAALSWGLIAAGDRGWGTAVVVVPLVAGLAGLGLFALVELRSRHPMVPPEVFAIAQFRGANLVTVAVYAGLGVVFFLLVVQLQQVLGYSALEAGAATLPITLLMLVLSSSSGQLAERIGPRLQMSAGPLIVAAGLLLMATVGAGDSYVTGVLPPVVVVGLGLAATVAPLTATALGAVDDRHAGVASGVNTTVARASQLAAVAAVPVLAGIGGDAFRHPAEFSQGFDTGMMIAAGLAAVGGIVGLLTIRNAVHMAPGAEAPPAAPPEERVPEEAAPGVAAPGEPVPGEAPAKVPAEMAAGVVVPASAAAGAEEAAGARAPGATRWFLCGIDGPALDRCPRPPAPTRSGSDEHAT
jgi:EmrB/QacA subfamily drug resistance transporter